MDCFDAREWRKHADKNVLSIGESSLHLHSSTLSPDPNRPLRAVGAAREFCSVDFHFCKIDESYIHTLYMENWNPLSRKIGSFFPLFCEENASHRTTKKGATWKIKKIFLSTLDFSLYKCTLGICPEKNIFCWNDTENSPGRVHGVPGPISLTRLLQNTCTIIYNIKCILWSTEWGRHTSLHKLNITSFIILK